MPSPEWSIEAVGFDLSGTDPDTWAFIAQVQTLGFPDKTPPPPYICTACGRDWMKTYHFCPICQAEGTIQPISTADEQDPPPTTPA